MNKAISIALVAAGLVAGSAAWAGGDCGPCAAGFSSLGQSSGLSLWNGYVIVGTSANVFSTEDGWSLANGDWLGADGYIRGNNADMHWNFNANGGLGGFTY